MSEIFYECDRDVTKEIIRGTLKKIYFSIKKSGLKYLNNKPCILYFHCHLNINIWCYESIEVLQMFCNVIFSTKSNINITFDDWHNAIFSTKTKFYTKLIDIFVLQNSTGFWKLPWKFAEIKFIKKKKKKK